VIADGSSAGAERPRETYDLATERADYPVREGLPDRTVVICSHPRSGSTLLGEALYAAGGLGCPLEYLHRGFRPHFARRWEAHDLDAFVRALHRFRTDTTGVLSIKLFWRDVEDLLKETTSSGGALVMQPDATPAGEDFRRIFDLLQTILPNPTFVHLTRRDRVRQAVSAFVAAETSVFRSFSSDDPRARRAVVYQYEGILRQLAAADYGNARWQAFFSALGVEPYRLAYEDLASGFEAAIGSVLAHLGHPGPPRAPRMHRQATAQSEEFILRFLRDHEAAASAADAVQDSDGTSRNEARH
jgi:LPS sulfotransferase NodH